ncbi:MAG: RecX family transcriptional regulator [Thermotogaceae bacterium]|jgi:regulatory protein|nr:RecX family transcriptional regulator [Mesotoga sp.]NLX33225.1 RecX family transcriptional regulator [Thermotogaceae bacterium]MDD4040028.1 regulatory protein RecX [Mesotoga sp.]MDD4478442.1 regulatory protein RecX [Mesotoga sp.]MDD5743151.1 regulatory protein RecX [Mesotoga sp.]
MKSDPVGDALRYLKFRLRSAREVQEYLSRRQYEQDEIAETIKKLEEQGLINDERFAGIYISDGLNVHYKGPFRLKMELLELGVAEETIEAAMNREMKECDLKEIIKRAIGNARAEDAEKLKRKLFRKGFSIGSIDEVLREIL